IDQFTLIAKDGIYLPQLDVWMGYALLAVSKADAAYKYFEKASKQADISYLGFDGMGCCLALQGDHEKAIAAFRQSILNKADLALAHLHLARSLEAIGEADRSE